MIGYPYSVRDNEIRGLVLQGKAKVVGKEGLQERPIVQYYGATYVKGIKFSEDSEPLYYRRNHWIEEINGLYYYKYEGSTMGIFPPSHIIWLRSGERSGVTIKEAYDTHRLDLNPSQNDCESSIFLRNP